MNEFDQFIKHELRVKNYVRYTDDFIIVSNKMEYLENILLTIIEFLKNKLTLSLHPKKVTIRKFNHGIDFLGYIVFPKHRLLRVKTKKRIFKKLRKHFLDYKNGKIERQTLEQSMQSYLGVLSHANTYMLSNELMDNFWF